MKKVVFLAAVLAIAATSPAQLMKGDKLGLEGDLHGMIGVALDSQYIWRGFAPYDNKSVVHVLADLNLFETGFGVSVAAHRANSAGYENFERWDYTLYYQAGLFTDEYYATNYRLGFVYYNFPDNPATSWDLEEFHAILSWPNLLPVKGLCPSYVIVRMWPAKSGSFVEHGVIPGETNVTGFAHIFMLDYGFTVPGILPDVPEQLIKLHSELVYNDGVNPGGGRTDSDWTNAVLGASTDFNLGYNITLTPALYYQLRMDESVARPSGEPGKNEVWASVGMKYTF